MKLLQQLLNQVKGFPILVGTKTYICVHIFLIFNLLKIKLLIMQYRILLGEYIITAMILAEPTVWRLLGIIGV